MQSEAIKASSHEDWDKEEAGTREEEEGRAFRLPALASFGRALLVMLVFSKQEAALGAVRLINRKRINLMGLENCPNLCFFPL